MSATGERTIVQLLHALEARSRAGSKRWSDADSWGESATGAAASEARRLFDVAGATIPPYSLEPVWRTVKTQWAATKSLRGVSPRVLRDVPWILFYPDAKPTCLGADPHFVHAWGTWARATGRRLHVKRLIVSLLLEYPRTLPTFRDFLDSARTLVKEHGGQWERGIHDAGLLCADAPERVAQEVVARAEDWQRFCDRSCIGGLLVDGRFAQTVTQVALQQLGDRHSVGNIDEQTTKAVLALLEDREQSIRFPGDRRLIVEGLLLPLAGYEPSDAPVPKKISEFLIRHWGDPRAAPAQWAGIDERAKVVLERWLASDSLDVFIAILDRTADPIWQYRREFWRHYVAAGVVQRAWLVLGRDGQSYAAALSSPHTKSYGRLTGTVASNQSALIMEMNDIVVVEWSHNGKCRLFDRSTAPSLYQPAYDAQALRADVPNDRQQIHHHSETMSWQRSLAWKIERLTGCPGPR